MRRALSGIDRKVAIGIGINTGIACVGEIGAENRFNYSAVGDSVNTTARIESMCKDVGFDILVSGATAERLTGFAMLEAGSRSLKGKSAKTALYLLVGDEELARTAGLRNRSRGPIRISSPLSAGANPDRISETAAAAIAASAPVLPELERFYSMASASHRS